MATDITGMAGGISEYGVGTIAVAILFVMVIVLFGVLIKLVADTNTNHRQEMIPVLKALTDSLDILSETQTALKEQLIEKLMVVGRQGETTHTLLESHMKDSARIESTMCLLQPSILKTEERTKACIEQRRKGDTT